MVRPLPGLIATAVACLLASGSTSNGSLLSAGRSSSGSGRARTGPGPAGDFGAGVPRCAGVSGAGFTGAAGRLVPAAEGRVAGRAAGLAGAADGFPDMDAPQNGQSSTSSSRTDALQDGQLRNSMVNAFSKTSCREGDLLGERRENPRRTALSNYNTPPTGSEPPNRSSRRGLPCGM